MNSRSILATPNTDCECLSLICPQEDHVKLCENSCVYWTKYIHNALLQCVSSYNLNLSFWSVFQNKSTLNWSYSFIHSFIPFLHIYLAALYTLRNFRTFINKNQPWYSIKYKLLDYQNSKLLHMHEMNRKVTCTSHHWSTVWFNDSPGETVFAIQEI